MASSAAAAANDRQQRLAAIAADWNIVAPPPPMRLTRPLQPFSVRTPNDDLAAEDLLKRQKLVNANNPEAAQQRSSSSTLKRTFTTSKGRGKEYDPKEVFQALDAHVDLGGSPGVAESLIAKLVSSGGDVNYANARTKTNFITRRRSIESFERSRLLLRAIQSGNSELVAVLVHYADSLTLDHSLPEAILSGRIDIVEHLLRYGASAANTAAGQDAFRQVCSGGNQPELIGLLLASDGRPSATEVSAAMVDAAKRGCVDSVLQLSSAPKAAADGNYNNAAALKQAISSSRVDIALAILTGTKPPSGQPLNEAFQDLFMHPTVLPNEKMAFAETLLCAGADGEIVAAALNQACANNFSEMVALLVRYGASVEYDNAGIVRRAISQNRLSLARMLLAENVPLSPPKATECIACIPRNVTNEERYAYLSMLLRKGAGGQVLHDCLIDATEAGDIESARLLLTPHFPSEDNEPEWGNSPISPISPSSPRSPVDGIKSGTANGTANGGGVDGVNGTATQRHHMASADHKDGMALQLAVQTANFDVVDMILATRPSPDILAEVFPNIFNLPAAKRYRMIEIFLATGFSGPCVNAALQQAIQEQPANRDQRLITLLLRSNADINFGGGAGILAAVTKHDTHLLHTLLQNSRPAMQTVSAALPAAMEIADPQIRHQMVFSLLSAGASKDRTAVAEALVASLSTNSIDFVLVEMLLKRGNADVNYRSGTPIILAVACPDPSVLELVLQTKHASQDALGRGLYAISDLPSTDTKAVKLASILKHSKQTEPLNDLLVSEVQACVKTHPKHRVLSVIRTLLAAGADVNANNATALSYAVAAPNTQVVGLLLKAGPTADSLIAAVPRVFFISDAMDRFTLASMILEAGLPASEASRALNHTVVKFPSDLPLMKLLATGAETDNGAALMSAIKDQRQEIVQLLLNSIQFAVPVLNEAVAETMKVADKKTRQSICGLLVKAGATGTVVSDALLSAAADGDISLGSILLENGASLEHQDGQAIVLACGSGATDVLKMLLRSPSAAKEDTLLRGFHEAEKVDDLASRANVFRLLLERGVHGEAVDKQLVAAASCGDDGVDLVKLLLKHGADTDYRNGEAVWTSARNVFLPTLKLLLGLEDAGAAQRRHPSQETMGRALKASWMLNKEERFQVIKLLFDAGMKPTEAVHIALNKAVKDDRPNLDLIRLLLDNGASPLVNGCQTLVEVACRCEVPVLKLIATTKIPQADLDYAFEQAFTSKQSQSWLTEDGLAVAKVLLKKGAQGPGPSSALSVAIDNSTNPFNDKNNDKIAQRFVELLVHHQADIDANQGQSLQAAARLGNIEVLQQLFKLKPSPESVTMAFPYIFDSDLSEDDAVKLVTMFGEYKSADGGGHDGIDVMFNHPDCDPVVFRAMSRFPRSVRILTAVLDAGYYHDQMTTMVVAPELREEETVSLLLWALKQPQKRVSSGLIELLVDRGSKVNFVTQLSMVSPLMVAITSKRPDLVAKLVEAGADVDAMDHWGNTPLFLSVQAGGDMGATMMSCILEAEPSRNDGSLHMAASNLNLTAMKMLVSHGHEVDFPSPLHEGRSALAEICMHGSDGGNLTGPRLKDLDKCIRYLIDQGSDMELQAEGKTPLLLALESEDPLAMTQSLLRAGMYKFVNSPFNQYSDGTYTYSPTMYVSKVLQTASPDMRTKLVAILKTSRAQDVYYAHVGPQPAGAVGMPDEVQRAERARQDRLDRAASEEEERARTRRHTRELAEMAKRARQEEIKALQERADAEVAVARKKTLAEAQAQAEAARIRAEAEAKAARLQAAVEAESMQTMILRREADHAADLEQAKRLGEARLQLESRRQHQLAEHEKRLHGERVGAAQQLSSITISERRSLDKLEEAQNKRERARMAEGRLLANAINQIPHGPGQRNVAGYIMGELN